MATLKPMYFYVAQYDSRTGNLVLIGDKSPVHASGPLDRDGVRAVLGEKLANLLLASPAPQDAGWEFQIEGEWQLWPIKLESLASHLTTEDGQDSGYIAHAYNPAPGDSVHLDIQERHATQGDVTMALTVTTNEQGAPSVVVHDGAGTWAGSLEVASSGKVIFAPGNYAADVTAAGAIAQAVSPVTVVVDAFAVRDEDNSPAYAAITLDAAFLERVNALRCLCDAHDLVQVRVEGGPTWEDEESFQLQDPEMVVTREGSVYFEDRPEHTDCRIQTRPVRIEELAQQASTATSPGQVIFITNNQGTIDLYKEVNDIEDSDDEG